MTPVKRDRRVHGYRSCLRPYLFRGLLWSPFVWSGRIAHIWVDVSVRMGVLRRLPLTSHTGRGRGQCQLNSPRPPLSVQIGGRHGLPCSFLPRVFPTETTVLSLRVRRPSTVTSVRVLRGTRGFSFVYLSLQSFRPSLCVTPRRIP